MGSGPTAVLVRDGLVYTADRYTGLRISSAADLTQGVGRADTRDPGNAFQDIQVVDGRAFLADNVRGLFIADVSDPAAPQYLGALQVSSSALDVVGSRVASVSALFGGFLTITDASDPGDPTFLGEAQLDQGFDVQLHGDLALVADNGVFEPGAAGLRIFDLQNPAAPSEIGRYTECGGALRVAARDDRAFVLCADGRFDIVDLSNLAVPVRIGRFVVPDVFVAEPGLVLDGDRAVAAIGGTLRILDISGAGDPVLLETVPFSPTVRALTVDETGAIWVAAGGDGVVKVADGGLFRDAFESGTFEAWSTVQP